jgi:3-phosphoshikimate 1-carboxyvinyltransferase
LLQPIDISVPSDFSSAAFFIVGALLTSGSEIAVRDVLLNPLRCGLLEVLKRMGGRVSLENVREKSGENVGDIIVRSSELTGTKVFEEEIPLLVDEVPILAVAASFAKGVTEIGGAGELRVKESDRIRSMATQLSRLGVNIQEIPDGLVIEGKQGPFEGGDVESFGDHRVAMSLAVFGLASGQGVVLDNRECISTSFPGFYQILEALSS